MCWNGSDLTLQNNSEGGWVIEPSSLGSPTLVSSTFESEFFRSASIPDFVNELAQSGLSVMAPGDVYKIAADGDIHWAPHDALTAAWGVQELAHGYLIDRAPEYIDAKIKSRTAAHSGVAECAWSAYKATKEASDTGGPNDTVDHVQDGLKAAQAATCVNALKNADETARINGQAADDLPPVEASWPERVAKLSGQADTGIDIWKVIQKLPLACSILPRIC